jgi:hypothetical protein
MRKIILLSMIVLSTMITAGTSSAMEKLTDNQMETVQGAGEPQKWCVWKLCPNGTPYECESEVKNGVQRCVTMQRNWVHGCGSRENWSCTKVFPSGVQLAPCMSVTVHRTKDDGSCADGWCTENNQVDSGNAFYQEATDCTSREMPLV